MSSDSTEKDVSRREGSMRKVRVEWILISLGLGGCALTCHDARVNNYFKYLKLDPGAAESMLARAAPPTRSPQVVPVARWDATVASIYARRGYVLVGSSGFTSGRPESDQDAIRVAIEIGADLVVILSPEYQGTVTASIPVTTPMSTTSHTTGTATAYGSGGPVMAYGNSTTTTNGTSTAYVPMTVQRSSYAAGYFIKRHFIFGAFCRDLSDRERQQLQTNRGAYVITVVDNTPAYNSDILPGDVIVGANGQVPNGEAGLTELLSENRGRTVGITLIRAGKTLSKQVSLLE
jgi:hypothetical protein